MAPPAALVLLLLLAATAGTDPPPPHPRIVKELPDSYARPRIGRAETELWQEALPPPLMRRLRKFYTAWGKRPWANGQGTNFVPLRRDHAPRNAVEEVVQYLARHVVHPPPEWAGVDWWLQDRELDAPKEYHSDTDTYRLDQHNERVHPQLSSGASARTMHSAAARAGWLTDAPASPAVMVLPVPRCYPLQCCT